MATAPAAFALKSASPTPRMKKTADVAPAVRISTLGVTFETSEMFWAPRASMSSALNWVTEVGTSLSRAVTSRPLTLMTSKPSGGPSDPDSLVGKSSEGVARAGSVPGDWAWASLGHKPDPKPKRATASSSRSGRVKAFLAERRTARVC
ncbi:MAG: hypothetical protein VX574_07595 [Myxococcota bacterium]|nr:hypothetical protein [Myxococcota bacterium]